MKLTSRGKRIIIFLAAALILPALSPKSVLTADRKAELDRRMQYWSSKRLPFCKWPGVSPYPSKFGENVLYDDPDPLKGQCNDGDGVIFNGVLCISGDDRGCDAVRRSQAADGEFWRSPRKVGVFCDDERRPPGAPPCETPFSNDHVLGVWAYIAHKKDKEAFRRWLDWIDGQPYPRFCQDKNCIFGVSDCPMLDVLALILGESNKVCDPQHKAMDIVVKTVADAEKRFNDAIARLYSIPGSDVLRPIVEPFKASFNGSLEVLRKTTEISEELRIRIATYARALSGAPSLIIGINALVNDPGPGQWDAAVEILLLKKFFGLNMPGFNEAASILAHKQGQNPFFEYVANGPTDRMLNQILAKDKKNVAKCPPPENDPPHARLQWTWERADNEQPPPYKRTMYWDCLTVANLYKNGPPDSPGVMLPPGLNDANNQASAAAQNAYAAVNSIISSISELIEKCQHFRGRCAAALLTAPLDHLRHEAEHALDQLSKGQIPTPISVPSIELPTVPGGPTIPVPVPTPQHPIPDPRPTVPGCPCGGIFCPCR